MKAGVNQRSAVASSCCRSSTPNRPRGWIPPAPRPPTRRVAAA